MWNSTFKSKAYKLLKRTAFKKKVYKPMKRSKLHVKGHSTASQQKEEVQRLVREIVIRRDEGCIFKKVPGHVCNGFRKDGELILQADHLLTRSNSTTYADTRLIVCVCKGVHGWKSVGNNLRKSEYDEIVRTLISPERVKLWDRCEADRRAHVTYKPDWGLAIIALNQELKTYD